MKKFKEYCEDAKRVGSAIIPVQFSDLAEILVKKGYIVNTTKSAPGIFHYFGDTPLLGVTLEFEKEKYDIVPDQQNTLLVYIGLSNDQIESELF